MSRSISSRHAGTAAMPAYEPPPISETLSVILCTGSYDRTIRFWEASNGLCRRTIQHPDSQINRLAISPDKRLLAAAGYQKIHLYDIQAASMSNSSQAEIKKFEGHTNNVTTVAWHYDAQWFVSASEDGTMKIWDVRTDTVQRNIEQGAPVNDCIIHPNQRGLISCDQSGAIKIWDLSTNACTHELVPEEDVAMRSVTMSQDEKCLIGGNNKGNCYVWNIENTNEIDEIQPRTKFQAHNRYLLRCLLSPDGRTLATCGADSTIRLWDMSSSLETPTKTLTGHQRWVWDMAFSADAAYLVSAASDHTARLWELSTGVTVRQYTGHTKAAVCVALNDINIL